MSGIHSALSLALPLSNSVNLGNFFHLSEPHFAVAFV